MNPADQLRPESRMDGAVALQPGHGGELLRPDDDPEMALAAFGIAGMTTMLFAFVNHFKMLR